MLVRKRRFSCLCIFQRCFIFCNVICCGNWYWNVLLWCHWANTTLHAWCLWESLLEQVKNKNPFGSIEVYGESFMTKFIVVIHSLFLSIVHKITTQGLTFVLGTRFSNKHLNINIITTIFRLRLKKIKLKPVYVLLLLPIWSKQFSNRGSHLKLSKQTIRHTFVFLC